ncbi:MAG: hypothetical protein RIQ93_329 [Verrucomicrobiota bacterium]|jgi:hypothetical protein
MMALRCAAVLVCGLALVAQAGAQNQPEPNRGEETVVEIGNRRELFVDGYLISRLHGAARLELHRPIPRERVMVFDRPWEGASSNYHSIFQDGDRYRMYYRGSHLRFTDGKLDERPHPYFIGYAESSDGINWRRPNVGLFEIDGSTENNVVLASGKYDGFQVALGDAASMFKDENSAAPPGARYKALVRYHDRATGRNGLMAFKSADGLRWLPMTDELIITGDPFDSQNLAFWDPVRREYRAYWRSSLDAPGTPRGKVRAIRTAVSKDFLKWEGRTQVTYVDSPPEEIYTNQIRPYHRAPHIFIGFPTRYLERPASAAMTALPNREHREMRSRIVPRYGLGITEGLLMASRDGVKFKRWKEAFLPPGIERDGTWNYGHQYIAWHIVETKSAIAGAPDELSLYAVEDYWTGRGSALRRYTLRLDGFVSVSAPMSGGEVVTRALRFDGRKLSLNFATSAAGSVRVEIQDADGRARPGFALDDCAPVFGDALDRSVHWKNGPDVSSLAGEMNRLRFVIEDGEIYSFQFQD